jgi:hypothetical protein
MDISLINLGGPAGSREELEFRLRALAGIGDRRCAYVHFIHILVPGGGDKEFASLIEEGIKIGWSFRTNWDSHGKWWSVHPPGGGREHHQNNHKKKHHQNQRRRR